MNSINAIRLSYSEAMKLELCPLLMKNITYTLVGGQQEIPCNVRLQDPWTSHDLVSLRY